MTGWPVSTKAMLLVLLKLSGAIALTRLWCHRQAVILTYHGVLPPTAIDDAYLHRSVVDVEAFDWQMRYLADNYSCLPLTELTARLAAGQSLPPHAAAVTFDDGFENNCTVAWPVLKQYGVPATVFLATGLIGQDEAMMWTDRVAWLLRRTPARSVTLATGGGTLELSLADPARRERSARRVLAAIPIPAAAAARLWDTT